MESYPHEPPVLPARCMPFNFKKASTGCRVIVEVQRLTVQNNASTLIETPMLMFNLCPVG